MKTWAIRRLSSVLPIQAYGLTSFSRGTTGSDRAGAHRWRSNGARCS